MPLFRRRQREAGPPSANPGGGASPARDADADADADWRSYDGIAETYAGVHAARTAPPAKDLVEIVAPPAGGRVLDVGTGTGVAARAAVAAGAAFVAGIDPSVPMLAQAAREGSGPRYVAAEAIDLPFRPESFDAVVCVFAMTHFAKAETALFDMLRVLRSGGRLGVALWGDGADEFSRAWTGVAEEFAEHEILRDVYERAMPSADRLSDPARLKDAMHEAGLRDIRLDRRPYRFQMTAEDYLTLRESASTGRFLRQMLGQELWDTFRRRTREVFGERFPPVFNDFRDVVLAAGHKP